MAWFFRLSRAGNLLLLGSSLYLAAVFLLRPGLEPAAKLADMHLLVGVVATCFVAAAGYVINDYFDVQIDQVNRAPGNTIIGLHIRRRWALALHIGMSAVGIVLGLLAGWRVAVLQVCAVGLLWVYSAYLKKTPVWGNLAVGVLSAVSLLVPWLVLGGAKPAFWAFLGYSFMLTLIREIVKDMEDMRGDAQFGCRTLPIVAGLPVSRQVVFALLGIFAGFLYTTSWLLSLWLFCFYLLLIPFLIRFSVQLSRADTRRQFRSLSLICKIMMAMGIGGMALV